jgi:NADH-quinone oxidoreductase subunit L
VLAVFDIKVIDGLVNLTAGVVSFSGSLLRYVQTGIVSTYAVYFVIGALLVAGILLF